MLHPDTANLAAFITIAAKPIASVKSMDDAVLTGKPVCNLKGSLVIPRVEALYPRVRWGVLPEGKEKVSRWEQAQRLVDADGCDGLLSTMMTYRAYKARPEYCSLEIQQVVVPQVGSWATNRQSDCVAQAISYGLTTLEINGNLGQILDKWVPPAPCSAEGDAATQEDATSTGSRRMLQAANEYGSEDYDAIDTVSPASGAFMVRRRRLKGKASGGEAGSDAWQPPPGAVQMTLFDFAGLFIMWGVLTFVLLFAVLGWPRVHNYLQEKLRPKQRSDQVIPRRQSSVARLFTRSEEPAGEAIDAEGVPGNENTRRLSAAEIQAAGAAMYSKPLNYSANDEAGMLREVLRRLTQIQATMHLDRTRSRQIGGEEMQRVQRQTTQKVSVTKALRGTLRQKAPENDDQMKMTPEVTVTEIEQVVPPYSM